MAMVSSRQTHRDERDRGAVIVEFAILAMLFLMLLWGIIGYGVIFAVQQNMTHAASEAGRASVGSQPDRNASNDIIQATADPIEAAAIKVVNDEQLDWHADLKAHATVTADVHECAYDTDLDCLTVTITYPWDTEPLVPTLVSVAVPDELVATSTIQLSQGS